MSIENLFDKLTIDTPCTEDWNEMLGTDKVRFCSHCELSVHDFAQLTAKQAQRIIRKSNGRLCVRYVQRPASKNARVLHLIGRRASRIAAGAVGATLSISSAATAVPLQTQFVQINRNQATAGRNFTMAAAVVSTGMIIGTVYDPNGAVITNAAVTLGNAQTDFAGSSLTNGEGQYKFDSLEPGVYKLKFEANGFTTAVVTEIRLSESDERTVNCTLTVATIVEEVTIEGGDTAPVLMGAVAIRQPTEPLVKAAQTDDLNLVREALVGRTDANAHDEDTDSTPLEFAIRNANREMVQLLLGAGANVNTRDRSGQTVLMMLGEKITADIVWDLVNSGGKVNLRDEDGDTALGNAAEINNLDVLKVLLDAGAKVNTRNNDGVTPLMRAASEGLVNNVRALILAGADINTRDSDGKTAFIYARENSHNPVMRLLRSYGADETEVTVEKKEDNQ